MNNEFEQTPEQRSLVGKMMRFCLQNRLLVTFFAIAIIFVGMLVAPFDWQLGELQRYPVPVDAIPDIGENQQIVFTEWPGRSPQDIDDQISYPLTVQLLGIPGIKTVRSYSMFGVSSIYVIFQDDVEFYWSRTRVLEKISNLPAGILPTGVQPSLGPDATGLGQVYWYTLDGLDPDGKPTGGWDLEELRTLQDWYAKYWLLAADGVAEIGSIGGFVREYQIDVDPDAMRAFGVTIEDVAKAIQSSNVDVGAKSIEVNSVEYFIRGVGFIKNLADIENSVVKVNANDIPVLIRHIASVNLGAATRRGALNKEGAPAVGGVVIARYASNPLQVISNVKAKIEETKEALPSKVIIDFNKISKAEIVDYAENHGFAAFIEEKINNEGWLAHLRSQNRQDWPEWATISRVTIVPFYDRTGLIYETLGTLNEAIYQEILITIIVVLIMVMHFRSGLIISTMLPLTVLFCFIGMKLFNIQANIVALSGIAIAIGTIVDMGIVICENILKHLEKAPPEESRLVVVHRAAAEVGSAVLTAVLTTIVSFIPVFTMMGAEGKLFRPLAFTKTFALIASVLIALAILPTAAHFLFSKKSNFTKPNFLKIPAKIKRFGNVLLIALAVIFVGVLLSGDWEPLGADKSILQNFTFVAILLGGLLGFFKVFQHFYPRMLAWCLDNKIKFLLLPISLLLLGTTIWLGYDKLFSWLPQNEKLSQLFPGLGQEFIPNLDEGSFFFMPTTMPHASMGEVADVIAKQNTAFSMIPEIESVAGKMGRAETPLDPAPISMIGTIINYKTEYKTDRSGKRINFRYENGEFVRDEFGELIPERSGKPFRQWREHIKNSDDIWQEIVKASKITGTTSAPKLQPIAARIIMLQSGMRAPMGVKIKGPNLEAIEEVALKIEQFLKSVPGVEPTAVIADRIVGKPYLEIVPNREALSRHGINIRQFQDVVEIAVGGKTLTNTVEGRERFPVRVRYQRELVDSPEMLEKIMLSTVGKRQIPLTEVAEIRYVRGPEMIQSEDTFLVGYVLFDKQANFAEVDVVKNSQKFLQEKLSSGEFSLPTGVSYTFAGNYENQVRANKTLSVVLPVALFIIFAIIYFEFKSTATTVIIFSGVFVAWAGGFLMLWFYAQPWFLDFEIFGSSMRELFQIAPINMSVAVWVGFLALFGIATDDGVVMATYLKQSFREQKSRTKAEIRQQVVAAGARRIRACLMTTATTILALLPVLTSTGRGSDIMV
ncbi:MAG: efflux RND transporter permease subunit, partial [Lentisphaeria bacterium]